MLKWLVMFGTVALSAPISRRNQSTRKSRNDAWNQIFHCLFSRRVEARVSSDFPEGAPFTPADARCFGTTLQVSTRVFERNENGDRAIDPLYPSFLSASGPRQILVAPQYSLLIGALQEALNEGRKRTAVARALMQADLWSAFDILYLREFSGEEATRLNPRKQVVLQMLARLIQQTALTPAEIKALPENYTLAARRFRFRNCLSRRAIGLKFSGCRIVCMTMRRTIAASRACSSSPPRDSETNRNFSMRCAMREEFRRD